MLMLFNIVSLTLSPPKVLAHTSSDISDTPDILDAVSRYSMNRGVAEETNDIPVDLALIEIPDIWNTISKENELGVKVLNSNEYIQTVLKTILIQLETIEVSYKKYIKITR